VVAAIRTALAFCMGLLGRASDSFVRLRVIKA
jgi:hypothetical protein